MKVLLTHGYFLKEDKNDLKIMKPYPLLGILYVSAYLKNNNIDHRVFDSTFSSKQELIDYISGEKPDIVGFYVTLLSKPNILDIIRTIRNNKTLAQTKIVIGGPDGSYNIENYIHHGADFLVIGEGEISFYELIRALDENLDPSNINGIAYKNENGVIVKTLPRERIQNIDSLGWPNWEAIDIEKYLSSWNTHHGFSSLNISTQRGCPFSCNWCSRGVFGHTFIQRSVENVIDEMQFLVQTYHVQSIRFVEDLFTLNKSWIRAFCEMLIQKKLPLTFECTTRAESLDEDIIILLRRAGCYQVWIGAESGSQDVINAMNTKSELGKLVKALQLLKKNNIETGTFIMIGYPGETKEDILRTMDFLKETSPVQFAISLSYPIKGTDFYKETESKFTNVMDWSSSTDRSIEFKRTYNLRFYHYAMRWMVNEMNYSKYRKQDYFYAIKSKLKSQAAFLLMNMEILRNE